MALVLITACSIVALFQLLRSNSVSIEDLDRTWLAQARNPPSSISSLAGIFHPHPPTPSPIKGEGEKEKTIRLLLPSWEGRGWFFSRSQAEPGNAVSRQSRLIPRTTALVWNVG